MSEVAVRPFVESDRGPLLDLFRSVYGAEAGHRTSDWRYLAPAPWLALIEIAEVGGRIVGAQPSHVIDVMMDGETVRGLLLLDVMTHPDYRRRGVFARVVEGLRARAAGEGYRLLLTTPNRSAERGFSRLGSWRRLGELIPWVLPADPRSLVAGPSAWGAVLAPFSAFRRGRAARRNALLRASGALSIGEGCPEDGALDNLWRQVARSPRCQVVHDARFLRWRFGAGSGRAYRWVFGRDSGGLRTLAVTGPGRLLGREVVLLADLLVHPEAPGPARNLLRVLGAEATREGRAAVVGWFAPGSPLEPILKGAGFYRIPRPLRPRPYSIWGWTNFPGVRGERVLALSSWQMSLADSDLG